MALFITVRTVRGWSVIRGQGLLMGAYTVEKNALFHAKLLNELYCNQKLVSQGALEVTGDFRPLWERVNVFEEVIKIMVERGMTV